MQAPFDYSFFFYFELYNIDISIDAARIGDGSGGVAFNAKLLKYMNAHKHTHTYAHSHYANAFVNLQIN